MNGLYKVHFKTSRDQSVGVVRIADGKLSGGDGAFFYVGTYTVEGSKFSAEIVVKRHSRFLVQISIFERDDAITLHGDVSSTNVAATGSRQAFQDELRAFFSRLAD